MKKAFFLTTVAAIAALCACSKTAIVPDEGALEHEIALTPVNGPLTRTTGAIDGTALPTDFDMTVAAHHSVSTSADYFKGVTFSNVSETNNWSGGKYWPLTGTLDFLAYANRSGSGLVSSPSWTNTSAANSVSLTVGDNSTLFDDLLYGGTQGSAYNPSAPTSMSFKHAFAVVMFTFASNTAYNATTNTGIEVTGVTVSNAKYGGPLTITNGATPTAVWGTLTNPQTSVTPRNYTSNAAMAALQVPTTASTAHFGDCYVILPPQTGTSITITYSIHNGKIGSADNTLTGQTKTFDCSGQTWAMGTKTCYAVQFTLNEILITPTVTDWTGPTTTNVTVN